MQCPGRWLFGAGELHRHHCSLDAERHGEYCVCACGATCNWIGVYGPDDAGRLRLPPEPER